MVLEHVNNREEDGNREEIQKKTKGIRMAVAVNDKSIDAQTINGAINGISRETDKKSLYTRRVCVGMETWQ